MIQRRKILDLPTDQKRMNDAPFDQDFEILLLDITLTFHILTHFTPSPFAEHSFCMHLNCSIVVHRFSMKIFSMVSTLSHFANSFEK